MADKSQKFKESETGFSARLERQEAEKQRPESSGRSLASHIETATEVAEDYEPSSYLKRSK